MEATNIQEIDLAILEAAMCIVYTEAVIQSLEGMRCEELKIYMQEFIIQTINKML